MHFSFLARIWGTFAKATEQIWIFWIFFTQHHCSVEKQIKVAALDIPYFLSMSFTWQ